jgi:hypothetical protein
MYTVTRTPTVITKARSRFTASLLCATPIGRISL